MKIKQILALTLAIVLLTAVFCGCKKSSTNEQTEKLYYDLRGNSYNQKLDIKFYDKNGNIYHLEMDEDYLPSYACDATGEVLNGFQCYITSEGYLFYDENNALARKEGTTDTYLDQDGNEYYDISTIYWSSNGELCHGLV